MSVRKVPQSLLGVSQPNPRMFGNAVNPHDPAAVGWSNANWLKSRFHFSFAEYHNPRNTNFGVLRVMNDDLVQPDRGFGTHGHQNAEICTYVVAGELTHQDSMGTRETLGPGAIQFMTAGHGVRHSEHNLNKSTPLRFIQMWLTPRARGLTPNYGSAPGDAAARQAGWHHIVSDAQNQDAATAVKIATDANMFVTETNMQDEGPGRLLEVAAGRQAYLLCIDGATMLSNNNDEECAADAADVVKDGAVTLERHDAAEIIGPVSMQVTGTSHLLMVEMAHVAGSGRGDL